MSMPNNTNKSVAREEESKLVVFEFESIHSTCRVPFIKSQIRDKTSTPLMPCAVEEVVVVT
jgi:hypothetical protein